ncbi:hypothetical protein GBA52_014548 [Prunus armeniaca]|nr:hypothetical protein GBA52_014548 [Prunus armeniaca]
MEVMLTLRGEAVVGPGLAEVGVTSKVLSSRDLPMRVRALARVGGEVGFWVEGFGWRRSFWRRGVIGGDGWCGWVLVVEERS